MSIKRLTTITPDLYNLEAIIPEHLKGNTMFLEFVEAYFEWMQKNASSPGMVINKLTSVRDIDEVEDLFIKHLQYEYAISIPTVALADKRKLYKQVNDIYRSKGSIPSYNSLFNLLFNETPELYFPRVDLLKPSEGKWDNVAKRYLNNDGFLSDRKYIQDSYYYQDFSYVIKTGQTIESWRDTVKKLLHPSGFAFFGQINIISQPLIAYVKSPLIQPGSAAGVSDAIPYIAPLVTFASASKRFSSFRTVNYAIEANNTFGASYTWLDQIKFNLVNDPISKYSSLTISQGSDGVRTNSMPGSEIVIS